MDQSGKKGGLTRKELIGSGATAASALLLSQGAGVERALAAAKGKGNDVAGMNIILFLTDQERAIQHFPPNWLRKNLPGMRRLRRHGLSFERAFTNACMCSPARSTLMSGYFPAQHGVKYTLEEDMPASEYPQVNLPSELKNLATVMKAAGYTTIYKGKWHCSKPATPEDAVPADLEKYGFMYWNPPDAGANQTVPEAGGGKVDNDGRFINSTGAGAEEGALQYLGTNAAQHQPFFMVISLVNPHDVLFYPGSGFEEDEYDASWLEGDIHLPETVAEDLSTKPSVQAEFLKIFNLTGKLKTPKEKRNYLNFYGNLMRSSDNYLVDVLDKLEETGLFDDTLIIRSADHGEMGLTHGGMRQKNFNFYEEATRIPLVYSNPKLFPKPIQTDALVSHVDFLPTLASLAKAPKSARADWQGVDYSSLVLHPNPGKSAQDYVVFTYDDFQSGQAHGPYPKPPNHIVSIREGRWKLAKYHDVENKKRPQWEMYDLKTDPLEKTNLAFKEYERSEVQEKQFQRLKRKLARVEKTRLQPLS
ncbi:MAG TPA: sulfatase-like hydrolase/transferase [Solirubrobacterales bacterium]|jgi:arylsulfatase A-like enzyme|nr:sulfatase-like hydrolase/transferase [Solirubrobacterales bacterium]